MTAMFALSPAFLRTVFGTAPFREYCRARRIDFRRLTPRLLHTDGLRDWSEALAQLVPGGRARVERELSEVEGMSEREALTHLLEAEAGLPSPPAGIPDGPPLALWFFLRRPATFRAVSSHHEERDEPPWRVARIARGSVRGNPLMKARALANALRTFVFPDARGIRSCAIDVHRVGGSCLFSALLAGRVRSVESFTASGQRRLQRHGTTLPVRFALSLADGTVFLRSPFRSADQEVGLLRRFGDAVLGTPVDVSREVFDLDRLKFPFHPLPTADGIHLVRVKSVQLRYPARLCGRRVTFDTLATDGPDAVHVLLRDHDRGTIPLDELRVCHAELQVRLPTDGAGKDHLVRLWPDRCGFPDRLLAYRLGACFRGWGLTHE